MKFLKKENPWLMNSKKVHVTAKLIKNTGWKPLAAPETVLSERKLIKNDQLVLKFPHLKKNQAIVIELTPSTK